MFTNHPVILKNVQRNLCVFPIGGLTGPVPLSCQHGGELTGSRRALFTGARRSAETVAIQAHSDFRDNHFSLVFKPLPQSIHLCCFLGPVAGFSTQITDNHLQILLYSTLTLCTQCSAIYLLSHPLLIYSTLITVCGILYYLKKVFLHNAEAENFFLCFLERLGYFKMLCLAASPIIKLSPLLIWLTRCGSKSV